MVDYIIVGCGLAGIAFCESAEQNSKTFVAVNTIDNASSNVAAGLYNPVILKRFSQVWHANEQLEILTDFYSNLEHKLNCKLDYKLPIYRKLFSIEEQNNWFMATDNPKISNHLSSTLIKKNYKYLANSFGFGAVLNTGYVDTKLLVSKYIDYLVWNKNYINESFDYQDLFFEDDFVLYKNYKAKQIIFCEGFLSRFNPFFNYLPLDGTKGEILLVHAPDLNVAEIINASIYLIPVGNDNYKVGATYNWEDKTNAPTEIGKQELVSNLRNLIQCDFEIIEHLAGVRPTVKDRRPLVGSHPSIKNMYILNGLGTRGVMLAPELASHLYHYIENNVALDAHIDVKRFDKFHSSNLDYSSQT